MPKGISNTVKVYIYNYMSARKNDFLKCRGCNVVRFGYGDRSPYVLYEATEDLFQALNEWESRNKYN